MTKAKNNELNRRDSADQASADPVSPRRGTLRPARRGQASFRSHWGDDPSNHVFDEAGRVVCRHHEDRLGLLGVLTDREGVLPVITPAERKVRVESGKGVGGSLTDLQASEILRGRVSPRLRANDVFGAIDRTTTGIERALSGCETYVAPGLAPAPAAAHRPGPTPPLRGRLG